MQSSYESDKPIGKRRDLSILPSSSAAALQRQNVASRFVRTFPCCVDCCQQAQSYTLLPSILDKPITSLSRCDRIDFVMQQRQQRLLLGGRRRRLGIEHLDQKWRKPRKKGRCRGSIRRRWWWWKNSGSQNSLCLSNRHK